MRTPLAIRWKNLEGALSTRGYTTGQIEAIRTLVTQFVTGPMMEDFEKEKKKILERVRDVILIKGDYIRGQGLDFINKLLEEIDHGDA